MTTRQFRNRPALSFAARASLLVFPALLSFGIATSMANGTEAGVSDFTLTRPEKIRASDIAEALAVPRGTRIRPSAPPTVRLPILFEFDSTELLPESEVLLAKAGAALVSDDLAGFRFSVEGHTDSVGPENYNTPLSEERAKVVKAYLIARGVPEQHLATLGHGEARPVASNDSDEGRQRNRRVEMINRGAAQ
jgi:outer membrane protein OmpA-like peptidoglycan-associated protein